MSINRVMISGNLTRNAELRSTQQGTSVLTFGVAVNDRRQNQQTGEWEDVPNFVDCVVWGNRAEALADILKKGLKVAVDGSLRYRSWEADDGSKRSKLEVVVREVELMTPRGDRPQAQRQQSRYPQQAASPAQVPQPRQQAAYGAYAPQAGTGATYGATAPNPAPHAPMAAPRAYQQAYQQPYQPQMPGMPAPQAPTMDVYDEDIPF